TLLGRHAGQEVLHGRSLTLDVLNQGLSLLLDVSYENDELSVRFDALLRVAGDSPLGDFSYQPVLFHEAEKPSPHLRMLLGIQGVLLGSIQGKEPTSGVLFHGRGCRERKANLTTILGQARRVLREIREARGGQPCRLLLNSHCQICEFKKRCQAEAIAK